MAVTEDLVVRHLGDDAAPWVGGDGIELKLLRVDLEHGTWVIRNRFAPGVQLPVHRHTGPVEGFTLAGRWRYLEYDFESVAGSYIHEPAGSVHTLHVPADNDGPTDVLFVIEGALLYLGADGAVDSVVDAGTVLPAYLAMVEAAGLGRPAVLGAG